MSRLAAGVVMVTCHVDGQPWGLTVSACCSVSMEPPLILASLGANTVSAAAISERGTFGISVLGQQLVDVARFGASRGEPKFMQHLCAEEHPECDSPAVGGAVAHIDCLVEQRIIAGDHVLFIGRVCNTLLGDSRQPTRLPRPDVSPAGALHRPGGESRRRRDDRLTPLRLPPAAPVRACVLDG